MLSALRPVGPFIRSFADAGNAPLQSARQNAYREMMDANRSSLRIGSSGAPASGAAAEALQSNLPPIAFPKQAIASPYAIPAVLAKNWGQGNRKQLNNTPKTNGSLSNLDGDSHDLYGETKSHSVVAPVNGDESIMHRGLSGIKAWNRAIHGDNSARPNTFSNKSAMPTDPETAKAIFDRARALYLFARAAQKNPQLV